MTLFWKAIYLRSRWPRGPTLWQRGWWLMDTLSCSEAYIWICKQTQRCLTFDLESYAWRFGRFESWGRKEKRDDCEQESGESRVEGMASHPSTSAPPCLLDPVDSLDLSSVWIRSWGNSHDTLSDWLYTVLFWDPGNKEQSGQGALSSLLNRWSKASTASAVQVEQQRSRIYMAGLRTDFEQGASSGKVDHHRNVSRFLSKHMQETHSKLLN